MDYYWPKMIIDAIVYTKRYYASQIHADYRHQPSKHLHPMITSWPLEACGIDKVRSIAPSSSKGHHYILTITDYFSKWSEAITLKKLKILTW